MQIIKGFATVFGRNIARCKILLGILSGGSEDSTRFRAQCGCVRVFWEFYRGDTGMI